MKTLNDFRAMLPVDKHRLDDELEVHADLMDRIAQQVVRAARDEADLKDQLARVEARLVSDYRAGSDVKTTVGEINGMVLRDSSRMTAFKDFLNAVDDHASWKNLLDAWRSKGFNIKTTAALYEANYYSPSSTSRKPRDEDQTAARAAMREAGGRNERAASTARQSAVDAGAAPRNVRRRID